MRTLLIIYPDLVRMGGRSFTVSGAAAAIN